MNREIKFRIWSVKENKMLYSCDLMSLTLDGRPLFWTGDEVKIEGKKWPRDLYPLMQYTGIKDINSVEIFEDDIVQFDKSCSPNKQLQQYLCNQPKQICYGTNYGDYPHVGFVAINLNPTDLESGYALNFADSQYIKVVGNIYKNPELLNAN